VENRAKPVLSGYDQFSVIHPTGTCQGSHCTKRIRLILVTPGPPATDFEKCSPGWHGQKGIAMSKAEKIIEGLGGAGNIVEVEACITRLRTEVKDSSLVSEAALKAAGAHGVLAAGSAIQVIVGPEADTLAEDIEDLL
jgi:N-acetylglucosamine PTS system EIIB component